MSEETISSKNISNEVTLYDNNKKFRYEMGEIAGKQYMLKYKTKYKTGLRLENRFKLISSEENETDFYYFTDSTSGGQGQGDVTSKIKLLKLMRKTNS